MHIFPNACHTARLEPRGSARNTAPVTYFTRWQTIARVGTYFTRNTAPETEAYNLRGQVAKARGVVRLVHTSLQRGRAAVQSKEW